MSARPSRSQSRSALPDRLSKNITATGRFTASCGSVMLTEGRMGRVGDRVAIRVVKPLRKPHTTLAMFERADEQNKLLEAQ